MNGIELKEWRDGMKWSQRQAASALDVTRSTYQDWEANGTYVPDSVAERAAWLQIASTEAVPTLTPNLAELMIRYKAIIADTDAMQSRGRPKEPPEYLIALERLYQVVNKYRGTLILGAERIGGTVPRAHIGEILEALNTAKAALDAYKDTVVRNARKR